MKSWGTVGPVMTRLRAGERNVGRRLDLNQGPLGMHLVCLSKIVFFSLLGGFFQIAGKNWKSWKKNGKRCFKKTWKKTMFIFGFCLISMIHYIWPQKKLLIPAVKKNTKIRELCLQCLQIYHQPIV